MATPADVIKAFASAVPIARLVDRVEVAEVVVFLTGEASSYVVGATFDVSGCLAMQ